MPISVQVSAPEINITGTTREDMIEVVGGRVVGSETSRIVSPLSNKAYSIGLFASMLTA